MRKACIMYFHDFEMTVTRAIQQAVKCDLHAGVFHNREVKVTREI